MLIYIQPSTSTLVIQSIITLFFISSPIVGIGILVHLIKKRRK